MRNLAPLLVALAASLPMPSAAQEAEGRRYSQFYNGSFVDLSARAGAHTSVTSDHTAWSVDAGLRQAFPMHLGDTRLAYEMQTFSGAQDEIVLHNIGVGFGFHPLYLALLWSDFWGYLVASFYVETSIALQYGTRTVAAASEDDFGARWSVGAGFDVPLSDPDRGWSVWLNFLYRFVWSDFDLDDGSEIDLFHHAGFGGLSVRFNGLLF